MNILITGGSGFIGKNLCEYYAKKDIGFLAPSHKELDLTDDEAVKTFFRWHDINVVIHAAGKPGHRNAKDTTDIFYENCRMFYNLAANKHRFGKMIVIGSGAVYDERYYEPKMREGYLGEHIPIDEHGFFRYVTSNYMRDSASNMFELRVFGVFGKYEDYSIRFISNAICKTIFGLPITIKQNRKMDYLYIDDLCSIVNHFVDIKPREYCFNVTPDKAITLEDLAKEVLLVSGKNLPIEIKQAGMGKEYSGDNFLMRNAVSTNIEGDYQFTKIHTAIKELYDWYCNEAKEHRINVDSLMVDK